MDGQPRQATEGQPKQARAAPQLLCLLCLPASRSLDQLALLLPTILLHGWPWNLLLLWLILMKSGRMSSTGREKVAGWHHEMEREAVDGFGKGGWGRLGECR